MWSKHHEKSVIPVKVLVQRSAKNCKANELKNNK